LAGCVDALDGGCGIFVGVGFGDFEELGEGEVVDLADDWWGEGGVEEGIEELRCEGLAIRHLGLGGRRFRKTPSVGFADTTTFGCSLGGPGEESWGFGLVFELDCWLVC
jgi:hypothetical protein